MISFNKILILIIYISSAVNIIPKIIDDIESDSDILLLQCPASSDKGGNIFTTLGGTSNLKSNSFHVMINGLSYMVVKYTNNSNDLERNECTIQEDEHQIKNHLRTMYPLKVKDPIKIANFTDPKVNKFLKNSFIFYKDKDNNLQYGNISFTNFYDGQFIYLFILDQFPGFVIESFKIFKIILQPIDVEIADVETIYNPIVNSKVYIIQNGSSIKKYRRNLKLPFDKDKVEFLNRYDINLKAVKFNYYDNEFIQLNNNSTSQENFFLIPDTIYRFGIQCKLCKVVDHKLKDKYFYFMPKTTGENLKVELIQMKDLDNKLICKLKLQDGSDLTDVEYSKYYLHLDRDFLLNKRKVDYFKRIKDSVIYNGKVILIEPLKCTYLTPASKTTIIKKINITSDSNLSSNYINSTIENDYNTNYPLLKHNFKNNNFKYFFYAVIIIITICAVAYIIWKHRMKQIRSIEKKLQKKVLKFDKMYPNILEWWADLTSMNFIKYCQEIYDCEFQTETIPDIQYLDTTHEVKNKPLNYDEKVNVLPLREKKEIIKEYKKFFTINNISWKRSFTMAKFPNTKVEQEKFIEYIFNNDIANIIVTVSEDEYKFFKKFYFPNKTVKYGNITFENLEISKIPDLDVIFTKVKLTNSSDSKKRVYIYCTPDISDFEKNLIEKVDNQSCNKVSVIPFIYEHISQISSSKNILIHSDDDINISVLMFTYFFCVIDGMFFDSSITNPVKIIQKVKNVYDDYSFGPIEYGYFTRILVNYFCIEEFIPNPEYEENIKKNYENYKNLLNDVKYKELYEFLSIEIIQSMLSELWKDYTISNTKALQAKCTKWFEIQKLPISKMIIRCKKFSCFDYNCLIYANNSKDKDSPAGFLNGNYIEYNFNKNKKKRLVMCQAPTKDTYMNMIHYLYDMKVDSVVIITGENETLEDIAPYLPLLKENNIIKYQDLKIAITIEENSDVVDNENGINLKLKVFHYKRWPQGGVPSSCKDVADLLKAINKNSTKQPVVIHGNAGIGRTGCIATLLYMIDMMEFKNKFDPICHLKDIRECRYGAVETTEQFLCILIIFCQYFKKSIEEVNPGAVYRYIRLLNCFKLLDKKISKKKKLLK